MRARDEILLALGIVLFLSLKIPLLFPPFIGEFEPAFQEMIALHHLENGMVANRFLSVIAEIDGEKFYHTAHPPLLHIIYASLYKIFGVKEAVSRICSLVLFLFSIFLFSRLIAREKRAVFIVLSLFFPAGFRLALTTNYELLSLFSISLFLFLYFRSEEKESGRINPVLYFSFLLGLLSDWTFYLLIPSLIILRWKKKKSRGRLFWFLFFELSFFVILVLYQFLITGESSVLFHSRTRSNPLYLFTFSTYQEFYHHLTGIIGLPCLILLIISWGKILGERVRKKLKPEPLLWLWLIYLVLLWLTAGQLVSRHYVYLLYLFPFFALSLSEMIFLLRFQRLGLVLILMSFFLPDYLGIIHKDARSYYLAEKIKNLTGVKTCFSSSALGSLYFYDKIETVVPVSKKTAQALSKIDFDLLVFDRKSPEVKELEKALAQKEERYTLLYKFPDLAIYLKKSLKPDFEYLALELGEISGKWWEPVPEVIWTDNQAYYGIKQPSGAGGISRLKFKCRGEGLSFLPALGNFYLNQKSDGVEFIILGYSEQGKALAYYRFLKTGLGAGQMISIQEYNFLDLIISSGPRGDYAWDDAFWLETKFLKTREQK